MNQAPAQSSKNLGLSPMEGVAFAAVGVFIGLSFLLYLAGEVAGILFKFERPGTPVTDFLSVSFGVVSHPARPALGWPEEYQSKIPGTIPYYFTLALLVVAGFFIFKGARALWNGTKKKDLNQAQWATAKDIKTLIVPHSGIRGRLVLGRSNGKLIATEPRQSVIVMGPTQTGKTTGFAVPAILEWDGPVIAASVKNDLVKDTFKWRRTQGEVWLFDPTRSTGFDYEDVRAGWSPLSQAIDWGGARKVSSWLCKANKSAGNNLSDGDFWFSAAEKMMSPYLFAAAVGGKDMSTILRWIDTQEEREVMSILQRAGVPEAMTAFEANMKRDERTKSSIFTTAETIIDAYNDPLVCESAANPTIFSSELLNGGKNTLYICAPSHEQDRLQAIFTAIVSQMKSAAYELAGKQNRPVDPPLLICIDEAANIAPLSDLDALASTAAGIGIQLVTIFQDMAQIEARYKERARTVVNNHRAKVILSGISDTGTLEYVSKLCGEEEVDQQSTSISAQGEKSTTDSRQQRTLASGAYLRRMKFGEGIVVYGQLSPAKLVLRQWFKDRVLKHMVEFGTKPGVMGGPAGSNTFASGTNIAKDASEVPAMSAVSADTRYTAGDMPGNQMASPLVPPPTAAPAENPEGSEQLSAFDKALAELRARDAGQTIPTPTPTSPTSVLPGTLPSTSVPTAAPPAVPAQPAPSPAKWKPSGGGVPEETDSGASGFAAVVTPPPTPTTSAPSESSTTSDTATSDTSTTGSGATSSKWSKGSRPLYVETPPTVPAAVSATASTQVAAPTPPPAPAPTLTPSEAPTPSVQSRPVSPLGTSTSLPHIAPVVPISHASPQAPSPAQSNEEVSDVFAQYGTPSQSSTPVSEEENVEESTSSASSGGSTTTSTKPKWK